MSEREEQQITRASARLQIQGPGGIVEVPLDRDPVSIGRGEGNTVMLADPRVSREHIQVEWDGPVIRFRDLKSQNGTWWRGQRCASGELSPGEVVRIGNSSIRLMSASAQPVDAAPVSSRVMESLLKLDTQVLLDPEADDLLERILDAAISGTESERGFVLEQRPGGMQIAAARGMEGDAVPLAERELSWSIAMRVAGSGEDLRLGDAREDQRFSGLESVETLGLRSVLCVPVRTHEGIRAVIYVEHRSLADAYSPEKALLLRLFANRAGMAIAARDQLAERARDLRSAVARNARQSLALRQREAEIDALRARNSMAAAPQLIGTSAAMRTVREQILRMGRSDLPVLLRGESGTGKELAARALHAASPRSAGPFVVLACAAMPPALFENELFGHERGAFTGAGEAAPGLFEAASTGTLFMDGIAEMSPDAQARLLRVLEEGVVRRLGSSTEQHVDVRVLASVSEDLMLAVRAGRFREDLFYRLHVLELVLPPLREHAEDVGELAASLLQRHYGDAAPALSPAALSALAAAHWPGNVRQLENELRRAAASGTRCIEVTDLDLRPAMPVPLLRVEGVTYTDLAMLTESIEMQQIRQAMKDAAGQKTRAAEMLGITRFTLQRKLDKYGMGDEG